MVKLLHGSTQALFLKKKVKQAFLMALSGVGVGLERPLEISMGGCWKHVVGEDMTLSGQKCTFENGREEFHGSVWL